MLIRVCSMTDKPFPDMHHACLCRDVVAPNEDGLRPEGLVVMSPDPASPTRTFYKRQLPCPPAVAFSSAEGALSASQQCHLSTLFLRLLDI